MAEKYGYHKNEYGTLYLIPTPLGKTPDNNSLSPAVLNIVRSLDIFMVEQMPSALSFLDWVEDTVPSYNIDFFELNKHTPMQEIVQYLKPLKKGRDAGIMSEAGAPGVADPGARLVDMAHSQNIRVVPLVGPSSIILGLMASGFNGQSFTFNGYLPRKSGRRNQAVKSLEESSRSQNRTEIFMETPHRNDELLQDVITTCHPKTKLCVAVNITLPGEQIISKKIEWWQQNREIEIGKEPTMFLLYAGNDGV